MDRSSEFIKDKALFGCYPTQQSVKELEENNVRYFVDLTCPGEKKITQYTTKYDYTRYSIIDHSVPTNWKSFSQFLIKLLNIIRDLKDNEKIYIHCKGGHGRSGIVVACILCYIHKITPSDAISQTSKYHSKRKEMREKWRRIGSPQTRSQKHFVAKFFEPLYIYKNYSHYYTNGFVPNSDHQVIIKNFGLFPTANAAFFAFKNPTNTDYVRNLELCRPIDVQKIAYSISDPPNWGKIQESLMYMILVEKFTQHACLRQSLLNTGLRPILYCSNDLYWGMTETNSRDGENTLGRLLVRLRKYLYSVDSKVNLI